MKWWQRLKSRLTGRYYARHSKAWTKRKGRVSAYDETSDITMPVNADGTVDYTLEDLGKMTILCAWCKKPIFVGEPITLYTPRDPAFVISDYAVVHSTQPFQLVGCLRWECSETGADRAGFWYPDPENIGKGHVYRVLSPIEHLLLQQKAGVGITNNLGDARAATEATRRALEDDR